MALRFYLVPMIGTGTIADPRRPQFLGDGAVTAGYTALTYGSEGAALVAATPTDLEHAALITHVELAAFPADLTQAIGGTLLTAQATLETFRIPAGWVTGAMTYRLVVRWISRLFMFVQRHQGLGGGFLFAPGITLDSLVGDLAPAIRQSIQAAAANLGISTQGITLATPLRTAWQLLADQLPGVNVAGAL